MLPSEFLPSMLVHPSERPPVIITEPKRPSRLRSLHVLFHLIKLLGTLFLLRLTGRLTPRRFGQGVRGFLVKMGTIWVKAGRILALRKGLFPPEFSAELDLLGDHGFGFPFSMSKKIVQEQLGSTLDTYFDDFNPVPFVSTTAAQVHMAHLRREGIVVAVKVQHPFARATFKVDMALIRTLARVLESLSILPKMRWSDLCHDLDQSMRPEIDFRFEAASLRQLRKTLRGHHVYVPEVFTDYSGERVLVMEFIHGALMSDYVELRTSDPKRLSVWLEANNIDPRRVARRLFSSVYRQIFEDNYFHGDMHPGNIILLRDSRIAFIDCRSADSLEGGQVNILRLFVKAIAEGEHTAAADFYFLLTSRLPAVELDETKAELVRLLRVWAAESYIRNLLPFTRKSLANLASQLSELTRRRGFSVQWSLDKMFQCLVNLDLSLAQLSPQMNYLKRLRRYFAEAGVRTARADTRKAASIQTRSMLAARELPKQFSETMMFEQLLARRQAQVVQGSATRIGIFLAAALGLAASTLAVTMVFLFSAFLIQYSQLPVRSMVGHQLFSALKAIPRLSFWLWVLVLAIGVAFQRVAARFRHKLAQPRIMVSNASD